MSKEETLYQLKKNLILTPAVLTIETLENIFSEKEKIKPFEAQYPRTSEMLKETNRLSRELKRYLIGL